MESFVHEGASFEQTRRAKSLLGKRVLSKNGSVFGSVKQVLLDTKNREVQGILVSRSFFRPNTYVSVEYVERLTSQAVILTIDPASLFRGRPVITSDGKRYGTVKDVSRERETNNVVVYFVRRWLFFVYQVPAGEVKKAGKSVVLHKTYEQAKSSFKKAS